MRQRRDTETAGRQSSGGAPAGTEGVFEEFRGRLGSRPFRPSLWLRGGIRQTVAASWIERDFQWGWQESVRQEVSLADGSRLSLECVWQPLPSGTLVAFHGMGGSSASSYMQGFSHKAFRQGWNTVLVNLYNTNLSRSRPKIFHAGASRDAGEVLRALLVGQPRITPLFLVGVSMGANILMKLLGEWGDECPGQVAAAAVISPLLDLPSSLRVMERPSNRLFQRHFLKKLKRHVRRHVPELSPFVDLKALLRVRSIREFDEMLTAPLSGFPNASAYYEQSSSLPYLSRIRLPTLVLHSADDPLLPRAPLLFQEVQSNPFLEVVLTARGGHVGFLDSGPQGDRDCFWAENRVMDFFRLFSA